jgi:hypothetical protein
MAKRTTGDRLGFAQASALIFGQLGLQCLLLFVRPLLLLVDWLVGGLDIFSLFSVKYEMRLKN